MHKFPTLRPVEAFPSEMNEQPMYILRDFAGFCQEPVYVSDALLWLLQFFNGQNSCETILEKFLQKFGEPLSMEKLTGIIDGLDQRYFLVSARFDQYFHELLAAYRQQPFRPMMFAGKSYAEDPVELKQQLAQFEMQAPSMIGFQQITGIVAPHIDIHKGGKAYAGAYQYLRNSGPIQRFIILGIAHNGLEKGFTATRLDFETPLGIVKTDQQFLNKLQQEISFDLFAEELAFRDDHTVEFQTVFLKHFAQQHENFSVVPILCSFSPDMLRIPEMAAPIHEFITALKNLLETTSESICVIAGVDLAHVGPLYEDDFQPDAAFLEQLRVKDQSTLSCVVQGNRTAFVDSINGDLAERKICGFSALYSLLSLLKPDSGLLVDYDQAAMDDVHSTVSFASAVFGRR